MRATCSASCCEAANCACILCISCACDMASSGSEPPMSGMLGMLGKLGTLGRPESPGIPASAGMDVIVMGMAAGAVMLMAGADIAAMALVTALAAAWYCRAVWMRMGLLPSIMLFILSASCASSFFEYSMMSMRPPPSPASLISLKVPGMEKNLWSLSTSMAGSILLTYNVRIIWSVCATAVAIASLAAAAMACTDGSPEPPAGAPPGGTAAAAAAAAAASAGSTGLLKKTGNGDPVIGR
mmetsp:Transcript_27340/g.59795  ORF Transcript_27340/g.59795 Transcript_27340/m.59795 type:complete len:240 (-) Transcript_27340:497-1216(-)